MSTTTIVIPMLNEAEALPALTKQIGALEPQPAEVLCVDGDSADDSVAIAKAPVGA